MKGIVTLALGTVLLLIAAAAFLPALFSSQRASNERGASALLKTIASAEADFKGNDRDKNGVQDFWTKDVAGLFHLVPDGETEPIQLISAHLAKADPTRPGAVPNPGYWFEAMDQDLDGSPYRQGSGKDRHPDRFGFLARPVDRSTGRNVFYLNEGNTIFKWPIEVPIRRRWFSDEELKLQYSKIE